jgi:hypothetical protein
MRVIDRLVEDEAMVANLEEENCQTKDVALECGVNIIVHVVDRHELRRGEANIVQYLGGETLDTNYLAHAKVIELCNAIVRH